MPTPIYSIGFDKPVDWVRRTGEPPIIVTRHPDGTASYRYAPGTSDCYDEYRASQMYSGTKAPLTPWEEHLRRHGAYGLRQSKPPKGCESALWLDLKVQGRNAFAGADDGPSLPEPDATTIRAEALKYATFLGLTKENSRQWYRISLVDVAPYLSPLASAHAAALRDFFESYRREAEAEDPEQERFWNRVERIQRMEEQT